jgi:hypothetical protein
VKRLVLFGLTVVLPCALLLLFGFVMLRQDRELALRHAEDQRRALAKERRQAEIVQLEQEKRAATEAYFAGTSSPAQFAAAVVEENRIRLPWDAVSLSDGGCEALEYTPGQLTGAIRCYSRALEQPHTICACCLDGRCEKADRSTPPASTIACC